VGSGRKRGPDGLVRSKPFERSQRSMCTALVAFALTAAVAAVGACVRQQPADSSGAPVPDALGTGLTVTASARLDNEDRDLLLTRARITNERSAVARFVVGGCPVAVRVYRNGSDSDSLIWRSDAPPGTPSARERGCPDIRNFIEIESGGSREFDAVFRVSEILPGVTRAADYRLMVVVRTVDPRLFTSEVPAGVIRLP
jgi:hypothetical protein